MRPEDLYQMIHRRPFEPLRLHLSDGTHIDIRHPETAFVTRTYVDVGTPKDPDSPIADKIVSVSLIHIVRVEKAPVPSARSA